MNALFFARMNFQKNFFEPISLIAMTHHYAYLCRLLVAAFLSSVGTTALAQAACDPAVDGFAADWDQASWTTGATSGSITANAADPGRDDQVIDISFSGRTQRFLNNYPIVNDSFNGGRPGQDALNFAVDYRRNREDITVTIDFQEAAEDVDFRLYDIDSLASSGGSGGFRDGVRITATGPSGSVSPSFTIAAPSAIYIGSFISANEALGAYGQANNNNDFGTLFVSFPDPITQVQIVYTNDILPPSSDPAPQGIGLSDISYCITQPETSADVSFTKTISLHSEDGFGCDQIPGAPDPGANFMIPGACVEYLITATNTGGGAANDLSITDSDISQDLIFVDAQISGFQSDGPGFGLSTPSTGTDCAGGCSIAVSEARLDPGDTGQIVIRATVK